MTILLPVWRLWPFGVQKRAFGKGEGRENLSTKFCLNVRSKTGDGRTKFSGEGAKRQSPLPRPHPEWGGGYPLPTPHPSAQSAKTVTPSKFFLPDMFTTIMKLDGIRGKNSTLPPGAGSSHPERGPNF